MLELHEVYILLFLSYEVNKTRKCFYNLQYWCTKASMFNYIILFYRILSHLRYDENNEWKLIFLYESFKIETTESGSTQSVPWLRLFLENLTAIFTNKRVRKRVNGKWLTLYRGVAINSLTSIKRGEQFKGIVKFLPQTFKVNYVSDSIIKCSTESSSSKNAVVKKVKFNNNGIWELRMFHKTVNLSTVQVRNAFTCY